MAPSLLLQRARRRFEMQCSWQVVLSGCGHLPLIREVDGKIVDHLSPSGSRRCARDCEACRPTTDAAGSVPGCCQKASLPSDGRDRH